MQPVFWGMATTDTCLGLALGFTVPASETCHFAAFVGTTAHADTTISTASTRSVGVRYDRDTGAILLHPSPVLFGYARRCHDGLVPQSTTEFP